MHSKSILYSQTRRFYPILKIRRSKPDRLGRADGGFDDVIADHGFVVFVDRKWYRVTGFDRLALCPKLHHHVFKINAA